MTEAIDKKETIDTDIQNEEEKIRHKIEIFKALSDEEQKDKLGIAKTFLDAYPTVGPSLLKELQYIYE